MLYRGRQPIFRLTVKQPTKRSFPTHRLSAAVGANQQTTRPCSENEVHVLQHEIVVVWIVQTAARRISTIGKGQIFDFDRMVAVRRNNGERFDGRVCNRIVHDHGRYCSVVKQSGGVRVADCSRVDERSGAVFLTSVRLWQWSVCALFRMVENDSLVAGLWLA